MKNCYTLRETEFNGIPIFEVHYKQDYSKLEKNTGVFNRIVIHHPGSKCYSISDLIDYHMGKLEMGAIGYHFVIDQEGKLYYTRDLEIKGAHAYPNSGKIGIGLLRSFDKSNPNYDEIETLKRFVGTLVDKLGLYVAGHNQDQIIELLAKCPRLAEHSEILQKLWTPSSTKDFDNAKQVLLRVPEIDGLHKDILNLKTCPGILAYKGMMQDVVYH